MINERKKFILETIIKEYVKTAQPVSSGVLVGKYRLDVSPATVRNEMMELEDEGYIFQPHTSSGRVPTVAAYELAVSDLVPRKKKVLKEGEMKLLSQLFKRDEAAYKQTAKTIADLANAAVFWAFHKNDLYHTGLSNLFSQPEFNRLDMVGDVSGTIDRLEEIIDGLFEKLPAGEQVLLGDNNPFGNFLGAVLVKYKHNNRTGMFGILGPLRMDYERNLALVDFVKNKFA